MTLHLSRLTLNPKPSTQALASILNPSDTSGAANAHHRLIWTLFADSPDRKRDFLWRYDGKKRFFTLSQRPPLGNDLFLPPETKEFAPNLSSGDHLSFTLRANATKDIRSSADGQAGKKSKRVDLVMNRIYADKKEDRPKARQKAVKDVALEWMQRQGKRAGFTIKDENLYIEDYSQIRIQAEKSRNPQFGVLDLKGVIQITDPILFMEEYPKGFGRAKSWGCGLMLIRRTG